VPAGGFNALADEVREATARLYLEQPDMALAGIACLLGFADQSTFNRAFKRWTGLTPKQARLRALHAGAEGTRAQRGLTARWRSRSRPR
jgi:AraC-like DNA-binding protein